MSQNDKDSKTLPGFAQSEYSPVARIFEGTAHNGKSCRIVDNTGTVEAAELEQLLARLIDQKEFGIKGLSDEAGAMRLGEPRGGHIQLGDTLYRMIIYPYEAILDTF